MPAQVVIAAYRPKPGREKDLEEIVRKHVPLLRKAGLATARPVTLLRSFTDGTLLEIFEWVDVESAQKAHTHPEVSKTLGRLRGSRRHASRSATCARESAPSPTSRPWKASPDSPDRARRARRGQSRTGAATSCP